MLLYYQIPVMCAMCYMIYQRTISYDFAMTAISYMQDCAIDHHEGVSIGCGTTGGYCKQKYCHYSGTTMYARDTFHIVLSKSDMNG